MEALAGGIRLPNPPYPISHTHKISLGIGLGMMGLYKTRPPPPMYGAEGETAVSLEPKRALTLAQELSTRGVQAIKADHVAQWGA